MHTKLSGYHSSSSSAIESMTACGALLGRALRRITSEARDLRREATSAAAGACSSEDRRGLPWLNEVALLPVS